MTPEWGSVGIRRRATAIRLLLRLGAAGVVRLLGIEGTGILLRRLLPRCGTERALGAGVRRQPRGVVVSPMDAPGRVGALRIAPLAVLLRVLLKRHVSYPL